MKNQGISLISLIITIIVIIILAAIVIFTGLGTPDSANFAHFCQDCDNVYSAVLNSFADLKASHATQNQQRTDEQIYIEVATGYDFGQYVAMAGTTVVDGTPESGEADTTTNCQNIVVATSDFKANDYLKSGDSATKTKISMKLPEVRETNKAWYVTKNGQVFNATGYLYEVDGKTYTYFNANTRTKENQILSAVTTGTDANGIYEQDRAATIATAIIGVQANGGPAVQGNLSALDITN